MTSATQPTETAAPTRRWRWLWKTIAALIAVFLVGMLADALVAARAEHKVAERLYADSNLPNPPDVMMAGFPYVAAALTHELEAVTVTARDVDVPGFGLATVQSSAQYVTVSTSDVFDGGFEDAPARKVYHRLQLNVVTLGEELGIADLQIQNKDDVSPKGGWETEATFTGTPTGYHGLATVEMKLRIRDGDVYVVPVSIISAPESTGKEAEIVAGEDLADEVARDIKANFSHEVTADSLPFAGTPMRTYVSGGSFFVEAEDFYTTVSVDDLAPPTSPLTADQRPSL